jgi:hypothetical protein
MRIAKRLEETEAAAVGKAQTVVGRRLEYKFSTAAGTEWFAGSVQAKSKAEPWLTVAFDDGEIMCVKVCPSAAGTAWRWAKAAENHPVPPQRPESGKRAATTAPVAAAHGSGKRQRRGSAPAAAAAKVVRTQQPPVNGAHRRGQGRRPEKEAAAAQAEVDRRLQRGETSSAFAGVHWNTRDRRWIARVEQIDADGRPTDAGSHLGRFDSEEAAARAYDAGARKLRGSAAHGGKGHPKQVARWLLNFPSGAEQVLLEEQDRRRADQREVAEARRFCGEAGTSAFRGVSYDFVYGKWTYRGQGFKDELSAARAFDSDMRKQLDKGARKGAHGHRFPTGQRMWLNFPTAAEEKAASAREAADAAAAQVAQLARAAKKRNRKTSVYKGVARNTVKQIAAGKLWKAMFRNKWLGGFTNEKEAALAHDAALRGLREMDPSVWMRGSCVSGHRNDKHEPWILRLNFPNTREKTQLRQHARAQEASEAAESRKREAAGRWKFGRTLEERTRGSPHPELYAGTLAEQVEAARVAKQMMPKAALAAETKKLDAMVERHRDRQRKADERKRRMSRLESEVGESSSEEDSSEEVEEFEEEPDDDGGEEHTVERVLADRVGRGGTIEYQVRWKGCSADEDTWEPDSNLRSNAQLAAYMRAKAAEAKASGTERLATSMFVNSAVERAMRRATLQIDYTEEPGLGSLPRAYCKPTRSARGIGAFAPQALEEGCFIGEYAGEVVREEEADGARRESEYLFDLGGGFAVDAQCKGNATRRINHSAERPNCKALVVNAHGVRKVCIYTSTMVAKDDELRLDYGRGFTAHHRHKGRLIG